MALTSQAAYADTDAAAYYRQHGYVIVRNVVKDAQVDSLLAMYQKHILPSKRKFYRQNTNVYEANRFTAAGHVIQSFLDIHNYKRFPQFRQAALDIYFADDMLAALSRVTGHPRHNLMQSMLFDANATTPAHQDWWYLDSVPAGNLLGAWIALEDIHEDAGRFYVLPGSHRVELHQPDMSHSEWLNAMRDYVARERVDLYAPEMRKRDVLFWNSRTIHGSLPTKDVRYSRKSLTAHYMPASMIFGNLFTSKPWIKYEAYHGHRYFANQPEYSLRAVLVSKVKVGIYNSPTLLRAVRKFQRRSIAQV